MQIPGQLNMVMMSGLFLREYNDNIKQEQEKPHIDLRYSFPMYDGAVHKSWLDSDRKGR